MSVDTSKHEIVTRPYREAWRRVVNLPLADQLQLYAELRSFLAQEVGGQLRSDLEVEARIEALEAMRQAAEHLGLGRSGKDIDPREISITAFDTAWKELGSDWSSARVIKAYGRWTTAKAALIGARVPPTPSQRAVMRAAHSVRERKTHDYFEAVAPWLASGPATETTEAYQDFRNAFNDRLAEGARSMPSYATISTWTGLGWRTIKRVARGEISIEQAYAERADQPAAGNTEWGEIIGGMQAAAILGRPYPTFEQHARKREFPPWVARVGGRRIWRRVDIEAYARGERDPSAYVTREEAELQGEILSRADVMLRLGLTSHALQRRIRANRWDLVPPPEGRIENRYWWWRTSKVGAWERDRPRKTN